MTEVVWFAPAEPSPPVGLLARYRPPEMGDAARWFAAEFTAPGDLVVDLFCHGPEIVRRVTRLGRRVVGANVNPLLLLAAGLDLEPLPEPMALKAAFTRLADHPKGDRPLRRHVTDRYASRCPTCDTAGVAIWFAWDREGHYPYAKAVDCTRCGRVEEGPTDKADIDRADRFEARGLAYHYFLNRVAPPDYPARERAGELVGLYTSRNLSALMDVTTRFDDMTLDRRVEAALHGILVTAFDRCSSLDAPDEAHARPRVLRPPICFVERNVWRVLEQELERLTGLRESQSPAERAPSLETLLDGRSPGYALLPAATPEVAERLPEGKVALIVADPPRRDAVFWALSALWAGWLWDQPMARAIRPFLSRRRFDWGWHRQALRAALAEAGPLLSPEGRLVTLFDGADEGLLETICQATSEAGYKLLGWGSHPEMGYHLTWRFDGAGTARPTGGRIADEAWQTSRAARAAELAERCLVARGEPTPQSIVHTAVCTGVAAEGDLGDRPFRSAVRQGIQQAGLQSTGGPPSLAWLPEPVTAEKPPLADRIERAVWEAFQTQAQWADEDLLRRIYGRFSGSLSPGPALVRACVASYGRREEERWELRPEDQPGQRSEEVRQLRADLRRLGKQLGFKVKKGAGWDVRWREGGEDVYIYLLSPTVELGRYLLAGPSVPAGASPCLVFPGGRAELLVHKLQRDPRLSQVAQERGWQFIKFRHLRRLIAEGLDRRSFEAVLGLDPVVGREGVQIPMLLEGEG